jgi:hypothetical protein
MASRGGRQPEEPLPDAAALRQARQQRAREAREAGERDQRQVQLEKVRPLTGS